MSEANNQQLLRLAATENNAALWRNNSGAHIDENGRMVRYGLGNDSKKLNTVWKSSDLIGPTPVRITPQMVGKIVGVFTAVEVKPPGWTGPNNAHEQAQMNFLMDVASYHGIAFFANDASDYVSAVQGYLEWMNG